MCRAVVSNIPLSVLLLLGVSFGVNVLAFGCPALPPMSELTHRTISLLSQCEEERGAQGSPLASDPFAAQVVKSDPGVDEELWSVPYALISLDEGGGLGWRWYESGTTKNTQIFTPSRPEYACAYQLDLIEINGRVWGLERWSFPPPQGEGALKLKLAHPRYTSRVLMMSTASSLSDGARWLLESRNGCPSLLRRSGVKGGGLLACGSKIARTAEAWLSWRKAQGAIEERGERGD